MVGRAPVKQRACVAPEQVTNIRLKGNHVEPQFAIEDAICKMGKISNNLEKHGEEERICFAIPITGVMLEAKLERDDPANLIAGDELFTRSVFNNSKGFLEPMKWVASPIPRPEKYENAKVFITLPSDEVLEFEGARVGGIEQMPTAGGMVQHDFQVQVHPDLDRVNLLLQEYQDHEIKITVLDAKIALKKKNKQQNLPLHQPNEQQPNEQQELARSSDAELEAARQRDETDRQLREALRGLEPQQPVDQVAGEGERAAANDSDGESSSEGEQPARAKRGRKGEHSRTH